MKKTQVFQKIDNLRGFVLCCFGMMALVGCSPGGARSLESSAPVATSPTPNPPVITTPPTPDPPVATPPTPDPPGTGSPVTVPSIFVVQDGIDISVLVFPQTASGATPATLNIPGSQVSVDGTGNIYVLSSYGSSMNVYSATNPTALPVRSLPVGPGTKIAAVVDVMASTTGEIFVSDGKGIAVFSATANGNDDPVRYILGNTQPGEGPATAIVPGVITVDNSDNLYVQNLADSSITVFGPTDTGNVVPARTIAGPLTNLSGPPPPGAGPQLFEMATDAPGNLYVLCPSKVGLGVLEFGTKANGNVAPIRFVTAPGMYSYFVNGGIAVDSAGTIYVSTSEVLGSVFVPPVIFVPAVFEFPPSASGSVTPSSIVTSGEWLDAPPSRIAVH